MRTIHSFEQLELKLRSNGKCGTTAQCVLFARLSQPAPWGRPSRKTSTWGNLLTISQDQHPPFFNARLFAVLLAISLATAKSHPPHHTLKATSTITMKKSLPCQVDDEKDAHCHVEVLTNGPETNRTGISILDEQTEKRLLRKLDLRIVPILWLMFMLAFLDRTNVCLSRSAFHQTMNVLTWMTDRKCQDPRND